MLKREFDYQKETELNLPTTFIKRDGAKYPFEIFKLKMVLHSLGLDDEADAVIEKIAAKLTTATVKAEDVAHAFKESLHELGYLDEAKAYVDYRKQDEKNWLKQTDTRARLERMVHGDPTIVNENANKDSEVFSTQRDLTAGTVGKTVGLTMMPQHIAKAHLRGDIHWHDLDYTPLSPMTNCCLIDFKDMLTNGFKIGNAYMTSPNSINVATHQVTQIITNVASSQYGGCSFDRADEVLAPFAEKNYRKHLKDAAEFIDDPEKVEQYARKQTKKDIYDAMQGLEYEINTMFSSQGQTPFTTTLLNPDDVFSVSFDDSTYDEASKAKALADINHWTFFSDKVDADEAMRDFPEMQYHMDEPDANPSIIPLWYLCKLARKHVTVALSGEGADELFAGYVNYGMHTHNDIIKVFTSELKKLPKKKQVKLAHKIKKMPNFPGKVHMYTNLAEPSEFYVGQSVIYDMDYPTIFTSKDANSILQPTYRNKLTVNGIYQKDFKKVKDIDNVKQMQYIDLHHFMLNDIEQKADKISMAHSLEVRVPYLDKKIAELANSIPTKYLVNRHDTKYALRKASEKVLPDEWAKRPKLGFPTPIKQWLKEPRFYKQVRALFEEEFVNDIFDQKKIIKLLDDNYEGDGSHRRQIWAIYTFLVWYKLFFVDYENTVKKYQHVQPEVAKLISQGKLL